MCYSNRILRGLRFAWPAVAAAAIALVLAACGRASAGEPAELTVVAKEVDGEYFYELPDTVPAGPVRIGLVNEGTETHHVQLLRLDPGITVDDLTRLYEEGGEPAVADVTEFIGGVGVVAPGERSRADGIVDLEPGQYAVLCFVPGPDGSPHLMHGMVAPLYVSEGNPVEPIRADIRIELLDYGFEVPEVIPGDAILEVTNRALAEPHEMMIARLEDGATIDQVYRALEAGEEIPAVALGGAQALDPARSQLVQLDLEPGDYVIWCQIPSPDGQPHVMKGMIAQVTVEAA
ncbi:MAG: hypothetical protein FWJ92_09940 [Actinomycetes bacterium]|nr:hypothetical protein [Acidimicrobiia bacterium]